MPLSRRHFFFGSLALPAFAAKKTAGERPNLVLILVDHLPSWMLGCGGNKEVRTPNIDRLSQTGLRLFNHFVAAPVPGPSRAVLMTGRTPMQLGGAESIPPAEITLPKILQDLGYGCGTLETSAISDPSSAGAGAASFIEKQPADKPFFLETRFAHLRPPYDGVPQKYRDMYAQARFETFAAPDPPAPNAAAGKEMMGDLIGSLRKVASAVTALDDQVGSLVSLLTQRKLLEKTLIVFTSTCGSLYGRHGIWDSGEGSDPVNMYEEVVSTPMIWRWPLRVPPQIAYPNFVSAYDFVPSICELTGAPVPDRNLCGRSYLPIVMGKPLPKKQPWRNVVFAHFQTTDMVRDSRYKLVQRNDGKGPNELYDLQLDPRERTNRYDDPGYNTIRPALAAEIAKWKPAYSA